MRTGFDLGFKFHPIIIGNQVWSCHYCTSSGLLWCLFCCRLFHDGVKSILQWLIQTMQTSMPTLSIFNYFFIFLSFANVGNSPCRPSTEPRWFEMVYPGTVERTSSASGRTTVFEMWLSYIIVFSSKGNNCCVIKRKLEIRPTSGKPLRSEHGALNVD